MTIETDFQTGATTEAGAVADIARQAAHQAKNSPIHLDELPDVVTLLTPDGVQRHVIDQQAAAPQPSRARGTVKVHDAPSFVKAVGQRAGDGAEAVLYSDEERHALVAILNDDVGEVPGWRDHRVALDLRPTPEWKRWTGNAGIGEQTAFAEAIEYGEAEIREPSAAVMLEIAQTFNASIGSKFAQGNRLKDGQTQISYVEDVQARAGSTGNVTIPDEFTIEAAPFVGSPAVIVRARIRYRVRGAQLAIGYVLVDPEKVEREAFAAVVAKVAAQANQQPIAGPAPEAARPIDLAITKVS